MAEAIWCSITRLLIGYAFLHQHNSIILLAVVIFLFVTFSFCEVLFKMLTTTYRTRRMWNQVHGLPPHKGLTKTDRFCIHTNRFKE